MASRSEQSEWTDIIRFWRGLKFFFSLFLFTFIHIITGFLGITSITYLLILLSLAWIQTEMDSTQSHKHYLLS